MHPVLPPFTQPATRSNAKIVWSAAALLGFLIVLAPWLLWPAPPLQAQKSSDLSRPQTLVPLNGITQVVTGSNHTCALTTAGGVKCWGRNDSGQLGDGSTGNIKTTPVDVVGLDSGVTAIAAGGYHTCALTTTGGVKCWGHNGYGQLGDGTSENRKTTPVDVVGLGSGVASIAAGSLHTCAVSTVGGLKCWGANDAGQLGDGTTGSKSTPVDVVGLGSGVAAIATGSNHTCALTTAGGVNCWGRNTSGQLGDGTTADKTTLADVVGLGSGVVAIAVGNGHTCALTTAGGVKCWGDNWAGQLGDGETARKSVPVDVVGLGSGMIAIAAGRYHTCALSTAGGVKCWGDNGTGQLGDGTGANRSTPVDVVGLGSGVIAIAVGSSHTCALSTAGGVKCWGSNRNGQLGDGTEGGDRSTPVDVVGLGSGVAAITAGGNHTCALSTAGGIKCWGDNFSGQLGDGTKGENKTTPVDVVGLGSGVAAIAAGNNLHTCALTTAGGVKCWGNNQYGQLGDGTAGYGTDKNTPVDVVGLGSGVAAIAAGAGHTCALTTTGGVKCWGHNNSIPVDVAGLGSGVASIAAGSLHTCAVSTVGGVKCWGNNIWGQLGDGSTTNKSTPVDVVGLGSGVAAIAAGVYYTCALSTAGGVKCWGANFSGQLGDGTGVSKSTPVDVVGLGSGVAAIAAGDSHTCALSTAGGVKCWGWNNVGQLGDGTLSSGVTAIAAGGEHTCAVSTAGGVKCWGSNSYGQLGDGSAWRTTPVDVLVQTIETPTPTPTATATATPTPTLPPPSGKQAIVFVHGINLDPRKGCEQVDPDDYFKSVDNDLETAGYDKTYAYLQTSPCYTPALIQNVQPLKDAIALAKKKTGQAKVILITHSMGGLVSRAYIEGEHYDKDVSALFTFGTPHLGVTMDALIFFANDKSLGLFCELQTAVCDFSVSGMIIFNLTYSSRQADVTYYTISGDAPFLSRNPFGKIMDVLVRGPDDGIVPTLSGVGLLGPVASAQFDEVHSQIFGSHSYFIRDGGPSVSYSDCLKPILVDKTTKNCGSTTRTGDTLMLTPDLAVRIPFEFGTLLAGETVTRSIELDSGAALFAAQWQTGTVAVRLVSPNGQTIDPTFASSHPSEVSYGADGLSATYYLTSTVAGTWRLVLQAGSVPAQGSAYTNFAAFDSEIALTGNTDRTWYTPGAAATITASLSGSPASAVITATILRTDDVTDTVSLLQTGPGAFAGTYTVPSAPGYTEVRFTATGTTAASAPFERGVNQAIQIASSSAAALSGSYADRGEDSAGDGLYETLAVDVGVTANVSGTFAVAAELVSAANGALIARTATSAALITGTHTLTLRFDGEAIRAAQQDGPYRVTSVLLIDKRAAALPVQEASDVWTTAAYQWQDFGTPLQLYLPSVTR